MDQPRDSRLLALSSDLTGAIRQGGLGGLAAPAGLKIDPGGTGFQPVLNPDARDGRGGF